MTKKMPQRSPDKGGGTRPKSMQVNHNGEMVIPKGLGITESWVAAFIANHKHRVPDAKITEWMQAAFPERVSEVLHRVQDVRSQYNRGSLYPTDGEYPSRFSMRYEEGYREMRVLLPAREIPEESTVTKRTGTKEYIVRREIVIRNESDVTRINAGEGAVFLVDSNGNAQAIGEGVEVLWSVDERELIDYLENWE